MFGRSIALGLCGSSEWQWQGKHGTAKPLTSQASNPKRERGRDKGPTIPFKGTLPPHDLRIYHKVPPPPDSTTFQ
jgi:hypothetical protein